MESAHDLFQHELQSVYDGTKRFSSGLGQMQKRSSHADLSTKLEELRKAAEEQLRRLDDIFHLMGEKPKRSESKPIQGFLEDYSEAVRNQKPEKQALDVLTCDTATHITEYLMGDYETLLLLAERSGVAHGAPRVSGHLKVSLRENKKLSKNIQKLAEPLIELLPPG